MLAHSHSQSQPFFPSAFQNGIGASPSFELRQMQFEQQPTQLDVQQYHLQQRLAMEAMQQQHQQPQGFMHSAPSFEQQLLLARAQFELQAQVQAQAEAQARAQAQAQALCAPFIHPGQLSHPNPLANGLHDNSIPLMPPYGNVESLVFPSMSEPDVLPTATQNARSLSDPTPETFAPIVDEQTGLSFPMENFYRSTNPTARQRTAQACEKCRDRKTKVNDQSPNPM